MGLEIINDLGRWRANCAPTASDGKNVEVFGKWLVGDAASYRVGELSPTTYTEWGDPMRRQVVTGIVSDDRKWFSLSGIDLDLETNLQGIYMPDPDDIVEQQALATGGLVMNGVSCDLGTPAQFDLSDTDFNDESVLGVRIGITGFIEDSTDHTFTVTGLDEAGAAQVEVITGPALGAIVYSTGYWSQITLIDVDSDDVTAEVSIGSVSPARMSMEVSRDGQRNWSTARWRIFDEFSRVRWNKVGAGRQAVFRFTSDSPAKFTAIALHGRPRGRVS